MGSQRVRQDWATSTSTFFHKEIRKIYVKKILWSWDKEILNVLSSLKAVKEKTNLTTISFYLKKKHGKIKFFFLKSKTRSNLQLIHWQMINLPYIVKVPPNQYFSEKIRKMEENLETFHGLLVIRKMCQLSHRKRNIYKDTLKCQFSPINLAKIKSLIEHREAGIFIHCWWMCKWV